MAATHAVHVEFPPLAHHKKCPVRVRSKLIEATHAFSFLFLAAYGRKSDRSDVQMHIVVCMLNSA